MAIAAEACVVVGWAFANCFWSGAVVGEDTDAMQDAFVASASR